MYADWRSANAPAPSEVLKGAAAVHCPGLLVDAWDKSAGGLFEHWSVSEVWAFCNDVRRAGLAVALAGSLHGDSLEVAIHCWPNLVAVRGAVCAGGRSGAIAVEKVAAVRAAVDAAAGEPGDKRLSPAALT